MAIASGLTCVDYLSTKFHSQALQEPIRFSPTFTELEYNDYLPTFFSYSCKDNQKKYNKHRNTHRHRKSPCSYEPIFDFSKLKISQESKHSYDTEEELTTKESKAEHNATQTLTGKCLNTDIKTVSQTKKDDIVDKNNNCQKLLQNGERKACKETSESLETFDILLGGIREFDGTESDNEVDMILNDDDDDDDGDDHFSKNIVFANGTSKNMFNNLLLCPNKDKINDAVLSDSEYELDQMTVKAFDKIHLNNRSNTRKRTSAEFLKTCHDHDFHHVENIKRPFINAEKMHRSIKKDLHRWNSEKEFFVPISIASASTL